jgi:membrane-associated phospholipid phosphatase
MHLFQGGGGAHLLFHRDLKGSHLIVLLAITILSLPLASCGTLENGRGWGQDAIYPLDLERIPRAAYHAFFDLQTLIPAAGAAAFAVDDFDEKVSDWAIERTPIFGSQDAAKNASDSLLWVLAGEALVTALATPSGNDPKEWTYSKMKGIGVELAALGATAGATELIKGATGRERPNERGNSSFPSGHSSGAFSSATLANRNLNFIPSAEKSRLPLQVGNILLATSVGWARVEGGKHFPSDVLAGAALGHFVTAFVHDAFLGLPEDKRFGLVIVPLKGGMVTRVYFVF